MKKIVRSLGGLSVLSLACATIAASVPAVAHHSFSMFDQTREQTARGRVVSYRYTNPHIQVIVAVGSVRYLLEGPTPSILNQLGWRRSSLSPGDDVVVRFHPLRNGSPGGNLISVTLENGTVMSLVREDIEY